MPNFCQIFSKKTKKISVFVLVLCLVYGLTPAAEAISVKLRGKIALGVILSGVAYTTHALIKRDRQAAAELRHQLGAPEQVVQFERGFDLWRIEHYRNRHYVFRNNRLLTIEQQAINDTSIRSRVPNPAGSAYTVPRGSGVCRCWQAGNLKEKSEGWHFGKKKRASNLPIFRSSNLFPFLTDMTVSGYPRWSQLYLLDSLQVPQFVFSDRRRLATERSLAPEQWLSR